jgi:hypothetical protein
MCLTATWSIELDSREAPSDWPYSRLAVGAKRPGTLPDRKIPDVMVYELNPKLVEFAYQLTKRTKAERYAGDGCLPRHLQGLSKGDGPSLRSEGRQPGIEHVLARKDHDPVGE